MSRGGAGNINGSVVGQCINYNAMSELHGLRETGSVQCFLFKADGGGSLVLFTPRTKWPMREFSMATTMATQTLHRLLAHEGRRAPALPATLGANSSYNQSQGGGDGQPH